MSSSPGPVEHHWIAELTSLPDEAARRKFLRSRSELHTAHAVDELYNEVVRLSRVNLQQSDSLARSAAWIAESINHDGARAQAARALGHVFYLSSNYPGALEQYEVALRLFEVLGRDKDTARTINGGMLQVLAYLGQYSRAYDLAEKARTIFAGQGDSLRLARLDNNMGNVLYRQDRFEEALQLYARAREAFQRQSEPQDVAILLRNVAVCHISLHQFPLALKTYNEAKQHCRDHGLGVLEAEADYNIAYLYFLRGEYTRAIDLYEATRKLCDKLGDPYHKALCDLDQAEMYLELNLVEGGAELAERAFASFTSLRMGYEAAKALTFRAIAASHQGKTAAALEYFDQARALFVAEQNQLWPALIDLYKALVLFEAESFAESRRLCEAAFQFFSGSALHGKAAICELLLARLDLHDKRTERAEERCHAALHRVQYAESPAVTYEAYFVLGQVYEAQGNDKAAYQAYQHANSKLEDLRSRLRGEELKIAFLKNKLGVYENLVVLSLGMAGGAQAAAFDYIERAKSRSLADLIAFRAFAMQPRSGGDTQILAELRQGLNWAYHQIELEEMRADEGSQVRIERLRRESRDYEDKLLQAFAELRSTDREFVDLQNAGAVTLESIRAAIPQNAALLEYYEARGMIFACVLDQRRLEIVPVAQAGPVRDRLRLLQFQLSKFRLGSDYLSTFSAPLHAATEAHLEDLYESLIAPVREKLQADHLVIVPHSFLHYLPFHALRDGGRYLIDDYSVSYAPSASVYSLCATKAGAPTSNALVLGIPDPLAPQIAQEVSAVAACFRDSNLYVGEIATADVLTRLGRDAGFIHIATHGLFRQDNPMFSSIRLGGSQLSLFDLYELRLSAELVTLSGCGTGLNVVVGGDELLGLVRGLLYAGAKAVVVTLWDVNDASTAVFMSSFYRHLRTQTKAVALQKAMRELRESYPHPYHWAPFVLVGKFM